jgi:uncharacterized protein YdbL (DUF1318 family)
MKSLRNPLAALLLCLVIPLGAFAADLDQAKRDGLVGERADGYLGLVVASAPGDVQALVADVNARRQAEYARIATQNGIERSQVEALAGRKAIERTTPGGWIFTDGGWRRK